MCTTWLCRQRLKSQQPGTVEIREERWNNSLSGTTNTDGHASRGFPLLPYQESPNNCNHLVNYLFIYLFSANRDKLLNSLLAPNSLLSEPVATGQNSVCTNTAAAQNVNKPKHFKMRQNMQHSPRATRTWNISPAVSSVPLASLTLVERKRFVVLVVSQSSGFGNLENEQTIVITQKCVVRNAIVSDIRKAKGICCMTFLPLWW